MNGSLVAPHGAELARDRRVFTLSDQSSRRITVIQSVQKPTAKRFFAGCRLIFPNPSDHYILWLLLQYTTRCSVDWRLRARRNVDN